MSVLKNLNAPLLLPCEAPTTNITKTQSYKRNKILQKEVKKIPQAVIFNKHLEVFFFPI